MADADLGTTLRYGFRNQPKPGDEDRTFGVPSVRNDINRRDQRSVADPTNYGNEPDAGELLMPNPFSEMGLEPEDWLKPRKRQEIRDIFNSIGC